MEKPRRRSAERAIGTPIQQRRAIQALVVVLVVEAASLEIADDPIENRQALAEGADLIIRKPGQAARKELDQLGAHRLAGFAPAGHPFPKRDAQNRAAPADRSIRSPRPV